MPYDSKSPIFFHRDHRETHQQERREERFEALMLQSWMQMRSRATAEQARETA